jgi:hypothetical protein
MAWSIHEKYVGKTKRPLSRIRHSLSTRDANRDVAPRLAFNRRPVDKRNLLADLGTRPSGKLEDIILDKDREDGFELCDGKVLSKAAAKLNRINQVMHAKDCYLRSRAVDESDEVPMALNILGGCRDSLSVIEPTFGLELPCVVAPKGTHPIDHGNGDGYVLASRDENLVSHLTIREPNR